MTRPLTKPVNRRQAALQTTTLRDFSGGLNVIDSELNLDSKYSVKMVNIERAIDGSIAIRQGMRLFATLELEEDIVGLTYYNARLVCVCADGSIYAVAGDGTQTLIWNEAIANALPAAPSGWGETQFASFAVFNNELIICNGTDKPLLVNTSFVVDYLQDPATGSNLNVPVCRYVLTAGRYMLMAGDLVQPDALYISNIDTSGVWYGDSPPNDGVIVYLGSRVPNDSTVKGIGLIRDKVVIGFQDALLIGTLGIYNTDGDHTPEFEDTIENYGMISQRSIQSIGDDMLFCDLDGVPSVARALFTGALQPDRVSQLIDPLIQARLEALTTLSSLEDRVFSVYDRAQSKYMLFIPNNSYDDSITETRGFVYRKIKTLKVNAWWEVSGWKWQTGTRSGAGRIFFTQNNRIYLMGDPHDPMYADYIGEMETFTDGTTFTDQTGLTPVVDENDSGIPIRFIWELPWGDFSARRHPKYSKYIAFDAPGTAQFTVDMFVDNIYEDRSDEGETFSDETLFTDDTGFERDEFDAALLPELSMDFVGKDAPGYGGDLYGVLYGGGRPSGDERPYAWPTKFNMAKIRVSGEAMGPLNIVAITMHYLNAIARR